MNFLLLALVLGGVLAQVPPARGRQPAAILLMGKWHAKDMSTFSGGPWLALVKGKTGHFLVRTEVTLSACEEECTGQGISVNCPVAAIALLRGVRQEIDNSGAQLQVSEASLTFPPDYHGYGFSSGKGRVSGQFDGKILEIWSEGNTSEVGGPWVIRARVGDRVQTLFRSNISDEATWNPIFVGDLDGDGKPDLILHASYHENVRVNRLYLSSAAEGTELVRQVATFRTVGC